MNGETRKSRSLSRRGLMQGAAAALAAGAAAQTPEPFVVDAGIDRVCVLPGKTFLRGFVGRGRAPSTTRPHNGVKGPEPQPADPGRDQVAIHWSKLSGPGAAEFDNPAALRTAVGFSAPGRYVLQLAASWPGGKAVSTVTVDVEPSPPARPLDAARVSHFRLDSPFWNERIRRLIVNWIPHCIRQINRTDLERGLGGIDNFIEAGRKLRGEPHGYHKGYVFSNAWVHQTIESMSLALEYDFGDDPEVREAQALFRKTLEEWIPIVVAAQEPDGYLQTAFTLPRRTDDGRIVESDRFRHWDPAHRPDHEGYVAGYFLEAAIAHHRMTRGRDDRLYRAAKKLADCWERNIGPPPKQAWYDDHQGMEQALFRFARYVEEVEGKGAGARYAQLAKFLLDCRYHAAVLPRDRIEYNQSHLPVVEQYEAVGHAVRAAYTYSAMADVVMETGDPDYRSAVRSLWASITHRKLYLTGGIGSGETSEGFGPDYSLPARGYCETCASCGELFFQWKVGRIWHDARSVDLYEDTLYNAILGSLDLEGRHYYYDNPLDARVARYRWHVCPCCVGNLPRTLLMLPEWMYAAGENALYVNLFVGSRAQIDRVAGTRVGIIQQTRYPWDGKVSITVTPEVEKRFAVHIRVPNRNASRLYRAGSGTPRLPVFRVNGIPVRPPVRNGYAVVERIWRRGDRIECDLPLSGERVLPDDRIQQLRGRVALRYGPLIYNIEHHEQDISKTLDPDAPIEVEWRPDLLGGVVVLRSRFRDGSPLTAIPNYARMNREPGTEYPPAPPPRRPDGSRPEPPPVKSAVWIRSA
ncbi:MAG: glycoside hydrolase family 127 protein [Bryobacteraceae bacterium]